MTSMTFHVAYRLASNVRGQMLAVMNKKYYRNKLFSLTHMPYSVVTNNNTVKLRIEVPRLLSV